MRSKVCQREKKTRRNPAVMGILALAMTFVMTVGCFNSAVWAASSDADYFGECTEQSTFNKESSELKDSYYFSDSWFQQDAAVRNDSLALVSMQLTAAYTKDPGADGTGFLEGLGFTDIAFNSAAETDPESCNYTHGRKNLADGTTTLIAVVIQSYSEDSTVKEQGWRQNFMVNGEDETAGEHFAFARAADKVIGDIEALGDSDTVFWVMGQSRGGALTNLIAKRLGDSGRKVYAYTFEAPATVDAGSVTEDYGYIHNYLCHDDIVTKIPMWGMTRYGNAYELKTDETDQDLQEELNKLGSEAAEGDVPNAEWIETDVVDYLGSRVAAREDYSAEHNDIFTDKETGEEITYTYSYQGSLMNLIGVIFRGGLSDVAGYLADNVADAWPAVSYLAEAVKLDGTEEALPYYYGAAKELHAFLSDASDIPIDLSVKDMYAVLRLIGPFALDEDYEPTYDPGGDVMGYLNPVINVALQAGNMTYSHHFDTLIARLKTLAPAPEIEDIDIKITAPEAGDDMDKAPSEVAEFFKDDSFRDAKDSLWISAEACWDTDDEKLQDDCVYYLDVTLETVGHTVPEDLWLKLNGELPAKDPVVTYDEGRGITRVTFEFKIGEPPEIEVSFDTGGKTDAPSPVTVEKGTSLGTVDQPDIPEITEADGVRYKLDGWYDKNGTPWEDVKVSEPVTMYAKWLIYIDQIDVTFVVPALGDKITDAAVPEDAPYYILEQYCSDPNYDTVDEASSEGEYTLNLSISKDPDVSTFALEKNEWDFYNYIGDATINGENVDEPDYSEELYYGMSYSYDESGEYVRVEYYFPVTEKETSDVSYTVEKGGGQTWTRGSDQGAEFVVKRSENDEETFELFKELKVDGNTVPENAYSKASGSLIIDMKASYLETLSEGKHTLTAVFEDGSAEADFSIAEAKESGEGKTPADGDSSKPVKTGDSTDMAAWIFIMAASAVALAGIGLKRYRQ